MSGAVGTFCSVVNGFVLRDLHQEQKRFVAGYSQQLAVCSISAASAISSLTSIFLRNASLLWLGYSLTFRGTFIIPCVFMFYFHRWIKRIEATNDLSQRLVKLEKELPTGVEYPTGTFGERVEKNDRAREVGEREFPRLGEVEDDNRPLSQRIDDACTQTALSRMQKVVYDIALVVYLHIPEIVLLSHLALSFVLLCSGIVVVGNLVQVLILLWTVGEQGLFFGFHPQENAGPFYAPLSRVIEIFSPVHFIFSKCLLCMKLLFWFRFSGPIEQIAVLSTVSYVVVNYFFPKFFDSPKFFRVIMEEDMDSIDKKKSFQDALSDMLFPSPDHFTSLVRLDLYEGKSCQDMLEEFRKRGPKDLSSKDTSSSLNLFNELFQEEGIKNLLELGLQEKDIKLIVGTLLEDPLELQRLLVADGMQGVCFARRVAELNGFCAEWYESKVNGYIMEKIGGLKYKIRQQFLIVLQQYRDLVSLQVQQSASQMLESHDVPQQRRCYYESTGLVQRSKLLDYVYIAVKPLLGYLTTNYYFYLLRQLAYGTFLGLSTTRVLEDQMVKMDYAAFCFIKWLEKVGMWLMGYGRVSLDLSQLMQRYFREWSDELFYAICQMEDTRVSQSDVWAFLSDEIGGSLAGNLHTSIEKGMSEEQFLKNHMPFILNKTGILKTGRELEAIGLEEGKAPIIVVPPITGS